MAVNKQLQNRALDLGFFPVELDFSEPCWDIIEQHEDLEPSYSLWMRHVPNVGDEIVFQLCSAKYYRGRVAKRAFEASSGLFRQEKDGYEPEFFNFCVGLYLWIDQVTPCPNPAVTSPWEDC